MKSLKVTLVDSVCQHCEINPYPDSQEIDLNHDFRCSRQRPGIRYIESMKKALGTIGAVLSALAISGCAKRQPAAPEATMIGMVNPASVYCVNLGGKTRIEKTTAGECGICVLPNGTAIDEWELHRRALMHKSGRD